MSEPSTDRPGAAPVPQDGTDALPTGARLGEFEIREVLGAGGFGIVYRAWDEALQRDVALKEYMPVSLAGRGAGERVTLRARTNEEDFALGLRSFVNEARLLARFDQPALVKVFRFWEGNGTAYMAMPLYKGRTLRQLRKEAGQGLFDDAWLRAMIEPVLSALEAMHDEAVYHRDIAPDNIIWTDANRPVLLDFGAARLVLGDRTQNVTAILKPQFAPIEQYAETQSMRQGPWTDLYALASTCYFLLTGRAPLPATARVMGDELEPLARIAPPGCSPQLLQALDWAMAVGPADRPQSVAQFRAALAGRADIPPRAATFAPGPVPSPDAFERTIQATTRFDAAQHTRAPSAAPPRDDDYLDTPERSVLLPPKSKSPLKALLVIVALGAAAAGAWTTRGQWMPAVGLQVAAAPADAAPSSPVPMPMPASEPASVPQAAVAAASEPDSAAASRAKAERQARARALEAKIAALEMPPPVLPPPLSTPAAANNPHAEGAASAAPAARGPNWRDACADQEPAKMAACIRRLCDNDARYQRYPVCQRMRRQEEMEQSRGTPQQ